MTIPENTRLDNAALIYPSTLSRKFASVFRVSVTLTESVSRTYLDKALKSIIHRFPSFGYRLHYGAFWWTLRKIQESPEVGEPGALGKFSFKKNKGYMFKVSCEQNVIYLDVFHAVTDGTGAATFLLSLTAEYLRLRYGIIPEYGGMVLDPCESPTEEEFNDGFRSFIGRGALDRFEPAYHFKGTEEPHDVTNMFRINLPVSQIGAKARELGCTVTELITALMIQSLQRVREEDGRRRKSPVIQIEVPVNLRKIYDSRTLRNFSSYLILGVDVRNGESCLEDTIRDISLQKSYQIIPSHLASKIIKNVSLENNRAIRAIPRILKKPIIATIKKMKGDRYCSHTFSNLGNVSLPECMQRYVSAMDFILGRPLEKAGVCSCISYGGRMVINISRKIVENGFEKKFIEELQKIGIHDMICYECSTGKETNDTFLLRNATLCPNFES